MFPKLIGAGLSLLLTCGPVWGRCVCCRPVKQTPVADHDCCKRKPKPDHKNCPHDEHALQTFDKVESQSGSPVEATAVVAVLDRETSLPLTPEQATPETLSAFNHSPPGLYLLNSSLLI